MAQSVLLQSSAHSGLGWVLALLWLMAASGAEPVVSNVRVQHRPGTMDVEVTYDLVVDNPWEWQVTLGISTNQGVSFIELTDRMRGGRWPVKAAPGQKLTWNPPATWLDLPPTELRARVSVVTAALQGMVLIKSGRYTMGSPAAERDLKKNEGPQTEVTLSRGYWLGKYEVTQKEWEMVMGNNPSNFRGDPALPVENVSWEDAMEYCRRVTKREREAGKLPEGYEYRLPTEAEWEYGCRAGTTTATAFGERLAATEANFDGNHPYNETATGPYMGKPVTVGSYAANAWGLHDMHGNVSEWCLDWYEDHLAGGSVTNSPGPKVGSDHVVRGGSWFNFGRSCRSAVRNGSSPSSRSEFLGFRVACAAVIP